MVEEKHLRTQLVVTAGRDSPAMLRAWHYDPLTVNQKNETDIRASHRRAFRKWRNAPSVKVKKNKS